MPQVASVEWAARMGADRVELYTEPFAAAFAQDRARGAEVFAEHVVAAERAHALGLGVNAGHDLDLENLVLYRDAAAPGRGVDRPRADRAARCSSGSSAAVREYLAVLARLIERRRGSACARLRYGRSSAASASTASPLPRPRAPRCRSGPPPRARARRRRRRAGSPGSWRRTAPRSRASAHRSGC